MGFACQPIMRFTKPPAEMVSEMAWYRSRLSSTLVNKDVPISNSVSGDHSEGFDFQSHLSVTSHPSLLLMGWYQRRSAKEARLS